MQIKKEKGKPLYKTLYEHLVDDILSGRLAPNSKLSSRRKLAESLGISTATVTGAYNLLIDNGFAVSYPKRGFFVAGINSSVSDTETPWEKTNYIYNLTYNSAALNELPYKQFSSALKTAANSFITDTSFFGHVSKRGEYILRKALLTFLYAERGIRCDIDHTVIGSGFLYLMQEIIMLFSPDTTFAITDPCDSHISDLLKKLNRRTVFLKSGFDIDELNKSDADVLIIYPEHHLPTGEFTDYHTRLELCGWLKEKESRYIIENPYDFFLTYEKEKTRPIFSLDNTGRVLYIDNFEHKFAPAIKTCFCLMPDSLLTRMSRSYYCSYASRIEQLAIAEMLSNGSMQRYLSKVRGHYKKMCGYIRHCIEISPLRNFTKIINDYAGSYFLLKINSPLSSIELKKRAMNIGIKLLFLDETTITQPTGKDSKTAIFGFGEIQYDDVPKILYLLSQAWCV